MTETSLENAPEEMTEEEINISQTAGHAAEEMESINKSQKNESTKNIAAVQQWLELDKSEEELGSIVEALRGAHMLSDDQKKFDIDGEIKNIADLLGQFTKSPQSARTFWAKNPSLAKHLSGFLEALSEKQETKE